MLEHVYIKTKYCMVVFIFIYIFIFLFVLKTKPRGVVGPSLFDCLHEFCCLFFLFLFSGKNLFCEFKCWTKIHNKNVFLFWLICFPQKIEEETLSDKKV